MHQVYYVYVGGAGPAVIVEDGDRFTPYPRTVDYEAGREALPPERSLTAACDAIVAWRRDISSESRQEST